MIDVIYHLGLQSNLKLCVDAGDSASYPGSGQVWSDRSGGGYHFNLGATSGAEASDPTFNGVAGNQSSSEYFSLDGGDWFTLGQTNPAWVETMHKAGALHSIAGWVYIPSFSAAALFGNGDGSVPIYGHLLFMNSTGHLEFDATNSSGGPSNAIDIVSTATFTSGAWNFFATSIDATGGTGFLQINGTQEAKTTTYSSPTTNNATYTLGLAGVGLRSAVLPSGTRIAAVSAWQGVALSQAQMLSLFTATRSKFGV